MAPAPATPIPAWVVGLPRMLYDQLGVGKARAKPRAKVLEALNAVREQKKPITDAQMRAALEELRETGVLVWSGQQGWALVETYEEAKEVEAYLRERRDDLTNKLKIIKKTTVRLWLQRALGPLFGKGDA